MSLRILVLGDQHFMTCNTIEVEIFISKLKIYLEKHQDEIDIIISMGDLLDSHARLHASPLNKAVEYVRLLSSYKPTYVIVGNHDAYFNSIFLTQDHWLNCLKGWTNVQVVDNMRIETIKGHKIVLCPYVADGRFIEALNTRKGEWENASCIFSHITIKGAQMGSMVAKNADMWDPSFPMLISGHIHLSHWLGANMYYIGSILQVASDESPDKHVAVIEITHPRSGKEESSGSNISGVSIREVDLHLPKKRILDIDSVKDLETYIIPSEPDTKYILYISGNVDDFKAFRKSTLYKNLSKLPQIMGGTKGLKFKQNKIELKKSATKIENLKNSRRRHFHEILLDAVLQEEDELLHSLYKHLVHQDEQDLSEMTDEILVMSAQPIKE